MFRYELIPVLLDISKAAVKEKIIRVCVSTWKNLLIKAKKYSMPVMIGAKVLDFLEVLNSRKLSDEELAADVAFLRDELVIAYNSLK